MSFEPSNGTRSAEVAEALLSLCRQHDAGIDAVAPEEDAQAVLERVFEQWARQHDAERLPRLVRLAREVGALERGDSRLVRLEALFDEIGRLGHTINNPLTSLMGRAQMVRLKASHEPQTVKAMEVVEESAKRIAGHVRELAEIVARARAIAAEPQPVTSAPGGRLGAAAPEPQR
jgi:signal transduction histidine kinase